MNKILAIAALSASLALPFSAAPALAETFTYKATINATSEVPPTDSAATGTADVTIDSESKMLTWTVTFADLSGDATAAHFHGPAEVGENAGPVIDISANTANGTADLTDAQIADFEAGKMYVNIHTAKFPDGEIRGQVTK